MANNQISIQVTVNTGNAQQQITALNQALAQVGATSQKSGQQAAAGMTTVSVSVQQLGRSFDQLGSALAGLGFERLVASMVRSSSDIDRIQRAMTMFTGSVQAAHDVMEQVAALARQTPFRFLDLEQAAREMVAFGIAAKDVPGYLQAITDQVAAFGGGIDDVNQLVNVFGRIVTKDFVGAMDLFRQMASRGVQAMAALRAEISKERGGAPVGEQDVKEAIKNNILDPIQVVNLVMEEMRKRTGGIAASLQDPLKAFKNLSDEIVKTGVALGQAFGPALTKLINELAGVVDLTKEFLGYLQNLPESTKEWIVNITAGAIAVTALATALRLVTSVISPLLAVLPALGTALLAVFANPALLAAIGGITAAFIVAYKEIPEVQKKVDSFVGAITGPIKAKMTELSTLVRQQFTKMFELPQVGKVLQETDENLEKIRLKVAQLGTQAGENMLRAFASPVEALTVKYAQELQKLNKEITDLAITPEHADELRAQLDRARQTETAGALFQKRKQNLDEYERYETERVKGAADAQVAYIEAKDAQDLRSKIAAIDQITEIRINAEAQVAQVQKQRLELGQQDFETLVQANTQELLALGLKQSDIDQMVSDRRDEMRAKEALADQKAFDESQKYRLEGWKKANDAIIEDQKRIYTSFRDIFSEIFDALTGKVGTIGQALSDVFKKLALGELRETFASGLAGLATQAAGYGVPEESLPGRGQGLLGILLRRGVPPRPPLAPPPPYQPPAIESGFKPLSDSAAVFSSANDQFALSVAQFADATQLLSTGSYGAAGESLPRTMPFGSQFFRFATGPPSAPSAAESAVLAEIRRRESGGNYGAVNIPLPGQPPSSASGAYQMIDQTWREATQATGVGVGFPHAQQAPQWMQDINALYLLRTRGTAPWAATGPYASAVTPPFIAPGSLEMGGAAEFPAPPELETAPAPSSATVLDQLYGPVGGPRAPSAAGGILAQLASVALGGRGGSGSTGILGQILTGKVSLPTLFGIGGAGGTSITSVLGSQGAGALAGIVGSLALAQGLQRRNAPVTVAGGALAGLALGNQLGFAPGTGLIGGAGLGLVASGIQRGGVGGLGLDVAGGALTGAALGFQVGGPVGALIGAGIGAAAGAIAGTVRLFIQTEQERIRSQIKQVYGIDISNRQILSQIQQIVDQQYGGSVSIGIRSQAVQNIVRLYALSTGQAANLPRPMYSATYIQSQTGGLALQPVYQGGQLVKNPYTGPTTYQYQTAVTAAEGLKSGTSLGVPGASGIQGGLFLQLNAQQAQQLMTGQVVSAIQSNPSAVANAAAAASRAGDSRMTTASAMMEPLTVLS